MHPLFSKLSRLCLCIPVFSLLISSSKFNEETVANTMYYGEYTFKATGGLNEELKGVIHYENVINKASDGTSYSTLIFKCTDNNSCNTMQFLLCRKNTSSKIQKGSYKVSRNFDSLLNYFDGVFGFANIKPLGEIPFFARKGKIQITHSNDTVITGELNISLENSKGNTVHLTGDFIAEKQ